MEQRVFAGEAFEDPVAEKEKITLYEAANQYEEIEWVARSINQLVREKGFRYREITVIAREASDYAGIIQEIFERHEIPCFLDSRRPVTTQPLMVMVLKAFEIVASSFSTASVLAYLKCGLTGISDEEIYEIENYCFLWNISGRAWLSDFSFNPDGMTEGFTKKQQTALAKLNAIRKKIILPLTAFEQAVKNGGKSVDFARAVFELLTAEQSDQHLEQFASRIEQDGDIEEADLLRRSWDMLITTLDRVAAMPGEAIDRDGFASLLSTLISLMDMGAAPKGLDEVCIGSAARPRPSAPRATFVIGANDGVFPGIPSSSGLLTDSDRVHLIQLGIPVADRSQDGMTEEMFLFYSAVCSPSERLFVSYLAGSGEWFPSPQVLSIQNALGIEPTSEKEHESSRIDTPACAFAYLAGHYRLDLPLRHTLSQYFSEHPCAPYQTLLRLARPSAAVLQPETSEQLFGRDITVSPTSVERFHKCRFCYFCYHGLRARTLRPVELDVLNRGTLVHFVIENLFNQYTSKGLIKIPAEKCREDIHRLVCQFVQTDMGGLESKPKKFIYQLESVESLLWLVVDHMARELADSRFITAQCELPIGRSDPRSIPAFTVPLPRGGSIHITGVIDRLDVFEQKGTTYFRVVDYKTGTKEFRLDDIYYGIGLQMLIYLYAVQSELEASGKNGIPAGVLYMPARSVTAGDLDTNTAAVLDKKLKMKGIILDDAVVTEAMDPKKTGLFVPLSFTSAGKLNLRYCSLASYDFFTKTRKKIEDILQQMGETLHGGDFSADPLDPVDQNGCEYCEFSAVCPDGGHGVHRKVPKLDKESKNRLYQGGDIDAV